jgi:hypothetical protein
MTSPALLLAKGAEAASRSPSNASDAPSSAPSVRAEGTRSVGAGTTSKRSSE